MRFSGGFNFGSVNNRDDWGNVSNLFYLTDNVVKTTCFPLYSPEIHSCIVIVKTFTIMLHKIWDTKWISTTDTADKSMYRPTDFTKPTVLYRFSCYFLIETLKPSCSRVQTCFDRDKTLPLNVYLYFHHLRSLIDCVSNMMSKGFWLK